ncbi:MAG: gliding motility-associated C-terminal domain-containing protein [Chitinophagaceae bacterium]|nr:gliding motility-associated C-terminal domain-containing protein [Chitinophagaceae bacterium]
MTVEGCIIPNGFSPNGDGINDVFEIPCAEGNVLFSVWNRWGIEVYRNEQYLNDWDGTPKAVHYQMARIICFEVHEEHGEEVNKAGFITLHR